MTSRFRLVTFSLMANLNLVHIIPSLVVSQGWSLHQMVVSNNFLYKGLTELVI